MTSQSSEKRTALCYVRLSVTKDRSDLTSPERQRANIQRACDQYGWTPEWYEDTVGHKSATKEANRPQWLALKARLTDPDVSALVVNEQSRAMRNAWRAIKLFEELPLVGVKLHLAALDRSIDITTPDGRMSAFLQAFMDDLYALDASRRAKDSVRYRKGRGVSVGIPPFGTIRDANGYLIPSPSGAWLLADGIHVAGDNAANPPQPDALWRGYYDCARAILEMYKDNLHGYQHIARALNDEGWAFRNRWNKPRLLKADDIRRVTSNWREYAGIVTMGRAKERIAHEIDNPQDILQETGRNVFEMELLRQVANTQEARSVTTRPIGGKRDTYPHPLSDLLYCAHCERLAAKQEDVKLRSGLSGWNKVGKRRYRHSDRNRCESKRKSIAAHEIEDDFVRLIKVLEVKAEALDMMADLALSLQSTESSQDDSNFEEKRRKAIAKHRRAVKNNLLLFQDGEIEADEYYRQKEYHERQIGSWEAQRTNRQEVMLELTTCVEMVSRLKEFWEISEGEDKKILAASLFDEIVYDLDKQQIVSFEVKPWAAPFIEARAEMYKPDLDENQKSCASSAGLYHDPYGVRPQVCIQLRLCSSSYNTDSLPLFATT